MPDYKKYYDILGVEPNSPSSDIKKVYLKLVKRYHPDTLGPDAIPGEKKAAEEYFKRIQDAYEIIYNEAIERESGKRKERESGKRKEKDIGAEAREKAARDAREKEARDAREKEARDAREKEAREKEAREKEARDAREKEARDAREKEARKIKCPNCGKEVIYGTKFCGVCGVDLRSFYSKDENYNTKTVIHPWHRFFARLIDYWSMELVLLIIFPTLAHENYTIIFMLSVFIWIFVEYFLLSKFGTTIGKWLFKMTIENKNGGKPSSSQAMSRSFSVWMRGFAMGIPIISFVTVVTSYQYITKNKIAVWDKELGLKVVHGTVDKPRIAFVIMYVLAIYYMVVLLLG